MRVDFLFSFSIYFSKVSTVKKIAFFEREFSSQKISITVFYKKNGLIMDICGPNDHLGGIGIGIPYIRKNGDESANFHCISIPSHRDSELAGSFARIISKITRKKEADKCSILYVIVLIR